jgi:hypothetical protein
MYPYYVYIIDKFWIIMDIAMTRTSIKQEQQIIQIDIVVYGQYDT